MNPKQIMVLPTAAQKRYQIAAEVNQKTQAYADAQSVIIGDIADSLPSIEDTSKAIQQINEEIKSVDIDLAQAQEALRDILQDDQANSTEEVGSILSAILLNTQKILTQICAQSLKQSSPFVSILSLMDIETELIKISEDLSTRGLYPEPPEEAEKRINETKLHTMKIIQFLKEVKAQSAAQSQEQSEEAVPQSE